MSRMTPKFLPPQRQQGQQQQQRQQVQPQQPQQQQQQRMLQLQQRTGTSMMSPPVNGMQTAGQTPGTGPSQQQQIQQQNAIKDKFVICNHCLQPIMAQKNLLSKCFHVLCVPCGNNLYSNNPNQCPICTKPLDATKDIKCIPTADINVKDLQKNICTFSPPQLAEMQAFALRFWYFQRNCVDGIQRQQTIRNLQQQITQKMQAFVQQQQSNAKQQQEQINNLKQKQQQLQQQIQQQQMQQAKYAQQNRGQQSTSGQYPPVSSNNNNQRGFPLVATNNNGSGANGNSNNNNNSSNQNRTTSGQPQPTRGIPNFTARTPGLGWQPQRRTTAQDNVVPIKQPPPTNQQFKKPSSNTQMMSTTGTPLHPTALFGAQRGKTIAPTQNHGKSGFGF